MENIVGLASRYAAPVAAAAAGALYLDAKHHIVKDIRDWQSKRAVQNIIAEGAKLMGDYYTLYHCLEFNDIKAEAFWFEGRSWTYGDVKRDADKLAQWFLDQGIRTKGMACFIDQC